MNIIKLKFLVDILMFIDFLLVAISGFVLKFVYPAGGRNGQIGVLFLFDKFTWLEIHDVTTILLVIFLIVHLILNWAWIKAMFRRSKQ